MIKQEFTNLDTGEVIELYGDTSEYDIRKKSQKEGFKKRLDIINNPFYWINMNKVKELELSKKLKEDKDLTLTVLGGILVLGCYINSDNDLICKEDKSRTPYTRKEIQRILRMKDRTYAKFLKVVKVYGIINHNNKEFRFNKELIFVEKNENAKGYARGYRKGIRGMFDSGIGLEKIGFILLVVPYIDYDRCCIKREEKAMTQNELIELLYITKGTVRKYLNVEFTYKERQDAVGNKVRLFSIEGRHGGICLNHLVIRRSLQYKESINIIELGEGFLCA